jgi:hypothetical protein
VDAEVSCEKDTTEKINGYLFMKNEGLLFFPLVLTAAIFSPLSVFGLGIRIADQDPATEVRGNAYIATADNPTAIYYNPAGITRLEGNNVSVGVGRKYEHRRRDVAYQLAYGHSRKVTGSNPNFLTGESADGRYEFSTHALTFTV